MKRIEFISPVEAVRGNLSGRQDLRYAENDNKAYFSPVGAVNYARNYAPRFIGAKRAMDGHKYFQVRTKSATNMTRKAKKAMAVMGGTGAIVAAIFRAKGTALYNGIYAAYVDYTEKVQQVTFRKYLTDAIIGRVRDGIEFIYFAAPTAAVASIRNPFYTGQQTEGVEIPNEILAKFWPELSGQAGGSTLAITFAVNGEPGIGLTNSDFDALVNGVPANILGLTEESDEQDHLFIKKGSGYLVGPNGYAVLADAQPVDGYNYSTSATKPAIPNA